MQTTSLSDTRKIWPALIIFLLVFTLCLLGIVSRPGSFLALFWPANAVLLAVLVRRPQWATRAGWGMAVLGYLAADLLTGSALEKALLLNAANLAGVVVGYLLFMRLSPPARMLQRGASSMYLFGICSPPPPLPAWWGRCLAVAVRQALFDLAGAVVLI